MFVTLEREIGNVNRKVARKVVQRKPEDGALPQEVVTDRTPLRGLLGVAKFTDSEVHKKPVKSVWSPGLPGRQSAVSFCRRKCRFWTARAR